MKILIIEDDLKASESLKNALTENNYVVRVAHDGEEGSYLARIHNYDAIILDYNLPKKNGLEVCREIRKDGKTTPIIMLSVKFEKDDKVELLNSGADDYVCKPYGFAELNARIKAVTRRPYAIKPSIIEIDKLKINSSAHEVQVKDKKVRLNRKEFALLEYLAQNQGRVVSRGEIFDNVWNVESSDIFSNTIESTIRKIRKKIDIFCKDSIIRTVSGVGYSIAV